MFDPEKENKCWSIKAHLFLCDLIFPLLFFYFFSQFFLLGRHGGHKEEKAKEFGKKTGGFFPSVLFLKLATCLPRGEGGVFGDTLYFPMKEGDE